MDYKKYMEDFLLCLHSEEKSEATIRKYMNDVSSFIEYVNDKEISKEVVIAYKKELSEIYKPRTVNVKIIAVNRFLKYIGRNDCVVKTMKIQRQIFINEDKQISMEEYKRLLQADDTRTVNIIKTIAATGIRVSELKHITVEAVNNKQAKIMLKGKNRIILIPDTLQKQLLEYIEENKIETGPIFISKNGKPLDRSNIWRDMKKLCAKTNIPESKVYPHNLRHLFARTFYEEEKDIVRLADILGHSSIETTRIYTMETGKKHSEVLDKIAAMML